MVPSTPMRDTGTSPTTTLAGSAGGVLLLREVATSPAAALYAAQRETDAGTELLAVKLLHRPTEMSHVVGLQLRASTLGALQHRHIVTPTHVLDVGGKLGFVSPFVDGIDLLEWVEVLRENNVQMPPRVVCELLRGVAVALDAAMHRVPWGRHKPLKFLHGDLKPTNIMVTRDGEVKVLDFGTGASQFEGRTSMMTRTARNYLSPERTLGRPPTAASDVYSLGILGIELLNDSWMHIVPSAPVEHDKHLIQLVRDSEFRLRSNADQQTLRSLLLRMGRHSPQARPDAAVVAQTLRRLGDRAPGPSLESFAHENAAPWLMSVPEDPETALIVQVQPVPLVPIDLPAKASKVADSVSNTLTNTDVNPLLSDDPSAVFLRDAGDSWDDGEESETQSIALSTRGALKAKRESLEDAKTLPDIGERSPIDVDDPTHMPEHAEPTEEASIPLRSPLPFEVAERTRDASLQEQLEEVAAAEVLPPEPGDGESYQYQPLPFQEAEYEIEEPMSPVWVALVAAGTGCVTFGAVLAVLVGIGLGFYLATLV